MFGLMQGAAVSSPPFGTQAQWATGTQQEPSVEIVLFGATDMVGNRVPSEAATCGRHVTCGSTGQAPVPAVTSTAMNTVGILAPPPHGQRYRPDRRRSGHRDRPRRTRRHLRTSSATCDRPLTATVIHPRGCQSGQRLG